jgi:hypothetical protein
VATRSKMSGVGVISILRGQRECLGKDIPLTKEFKMDMARLEIPVSG